MQHKKFLICSRTKVDMPSYEDWLVTALKPRARQKLRMVVMSSCIFYENIIPANFMCFSKVFYHTTVQSLTWMNISVDFKPI